MSARRQVPGGYHASRRHRLGALTAWATLAVALTAAPARLRAEPTYAMRLPFCDQRAALQRQHPNTYGFHSYDWKLPSVVRYVVRPGSTSTPASFRAELDPDVRFDLGDGSYLNWAYSVGCEYATTPMSLSDPLPAWGKGSRVILLLPERQVLRRIGRMEFRVPVPVELLRATGVSTSTSASTIKGEVELGGLAVSDYGYTPGTSYTLTLTLSTQSLTDSAYRPARSETFTLSANQPRTRYSVSAPLPAGYARVQLQVTITSSKGGGAIPLSLYDTQLTGARDAGMIRDELGALRWRADYLLELLHLRELLHAQYLAGAQAMMCKALEIVDALKNATEGLLGTWYPSYAAWRDDALGAQSFDLADAALVSAQAQGALPAAIDPWTHLATQGSALRASCRTTPVGLPTAAAFAAISGEAGRLGKENAERYAASLAELKQYQQRALALIELIHDDLDDHLWAQLTE